MVISVTGPRAPCCRPTEEDQEQPFVCAEHRGHVPWQHVRVPCPLLGARGTRPQGSGEVTAGHLSESYVLIDGMIQNMNSSAFPRVVTGITGVEPPAQSRLYSSWAVCEDEALKSPLQECQENGSRCSFSDPGTRLDMLGLVSGIPDESNNLEPVTDWDLLSRLFPPLWTSEVDEPKDFSVHLPNPLPVVGDEIHGEPIRTLPNMESLQRGFEDLGLLESFVPHPEPQLDNLLNDVYSEETFQRNEESPQHCGDYGKFNSMSYGSTVGGHWAKEYAGFPKNICKGEKGRRKFLNSVGQSNYSSGSSDGWTKENHLKACDFMPLGMKPSTLQYNQEYSKGRGVHALSQSRAYSEESENKFIKVPNVCFMDSSEVRHNENLHPSFFGSRWLDGELLANQKPATSPLPSSTSSSLSDGSPTRRSLSQQSYYSHASSGPASPESGQTPRTAPANKVPFSSFIEENQRPTKPFGPLSPGEDVARPEIPVGFPGYPAQGYHRLPRKTNPQQNGNAERRGRRSWSGQQGNVHQNPQQFNFHRKQEPNVGNMSDFINTSFLPPFALMSDNKQSQNFPPFNPQAYTPPTNLPFPPPALPFSDLFDLLHYEDLNRLNPFLSDLLCSELPPPPPPPPPPYISYPTPFSKCRPQRNRSGPASELHVHLEECSEQLRALEKERKTTEAELGRHFPGNRASGSYNSAIPRLPTNPSRVDRLIVDEFREHARAVSLVKIMERICSCALHVNITLALEHHLEAIRLTQSRRKDEIVNAANRQKQGAPRYNNERDVLALAAAIKDMAASTRRARTALWCAVQMTLPKSSSGSAVTQEDLERALQELFPTKAGICADIKDGKKGSE